jgi:methyl-accepting chemotaxis protein
MLSISRLVNRNREDESGIVGFNLAVVIAFALYAVIQLSRVVLAGSQIDDRVKVIITEIGPGSNVSRLDETQKLNETGRMAEDILAAAQPLSGQLGQVVTAAQSIDGTVSRINTTAGEINQTVRGIDGTTRALLPVVQNIHGDDSMSAPRPRCPWCRASRAT